MKQNYKRFFAITLCSLSCAFLIASFVIDLMPSQGTTENQLIGYGGSILSFAIMCYAYYCMLYGNINGTFIAYRGLLWFMIYAALDLLLYSLSIGTSIFANMEAAGSAPLFMATLVAFFIFAVLGLIAGIFSYIRVSQYLRSAYAKYEMIRLWSLLFAICFVLVMGLKIGITAWMLSSSGYTPLQIFLSTLSPISEALMAVACFFTVIRLKSEY